MPSSRALKIAALAACLNGLSAITFAKDAAADTAAPSTNRPALLNDAFNALLDDQGRWAYTETRAGTVDGKTNSETIFRIDPSLPYAEQNKPLKIRGKEPTEKQLKEAADRAESAAKRRLEHRQKEAEANSTSGNPAAHRSAEVKLSIVGRVVTPDLDHAKVVQDNATSVTYAIPMHPDGKNNSDTLFDKFELTAQVSKESHQFERAMIRQRSSMRVALIAKLSETVFVFEFTRPAPRFSSVPTKFTSDAHFKVLFGKEHVRHSESVRTELQRVTPYDERFGVKVGPTRTLEL
jgi:hypothetical protein